METVTSKDGTTLAYERLGTGPALACTARAGWRAGDGRFRLRLHTSSLIPVQAAGPGAAGP